MKLAGACPKTEEMAFLTTDGQAATRLEGKVHAIGRILENPIIKNHGISAKCGIS